MQYMTAFAFTRAIVDVSFRLSLSNFDRGETTGHLKSKQHVHLVRPPKCDHSCCTPHAGSAAFAGVHVLTTMAPKRIAINGSNSKVAKKGKVSDVLTRAIATLPRKELVELFSTHVLPGVIDKAFRGIFQEALNAHSRTDAEKQEINVGFLREKHCKEGKRLEEVSQAPRILGGAILYDVRHPWRDKRLAE